ncbi:MAG: transglutaminase-like domain-containing protein, partial [Prevotellaceae bacterium]|nr:transglutaminase-like domain-containing protein [Prevotellaceae bacterium]
MERKMKNKLMITINCETDYEKAKSIHDWVAANIYYNMDGYYSSSYGSTDALGVLQNKKTVCQGYANLTAAMLRSLQIPCSVVSGYALGIGTSGSWSIRNIVEATNHAWNEAFISGRWIIIDATWDSDMQYRNSQFDSGKGLRGWKYFDPTLEAFSFDHKYGVYDKTINEKIANITEDYIWQTISSKHK